MSALPRERTSRRTTRYVRFVPEPAVSRCNIGCNLLDHLVGQGKQPIGHVEVEVLVIERPVDFSYDACWLECPACRDRVVMTFEDRANGESRTCSSGHDVSAQEEYPALTPSRANAPGSPGF